MFPFLSLCGTFHAADQSRWGRLSPSYWGHTSHQLWSSLSFACFRMALNGQLDSKTRGSLSPSFWVTTFTIQLPANGSIFSLTNSTNKISGFKSTNLPAFWAFESCVSALPLWMSDVYFWLLISQAALIRWSYCNEPCLGVIVKRNHFEIEISLSADIISPRPISLRKGCLDRCRLTKVWAQAPGSLHPQSTLDMLVPELELNEKKTRNFSNRMLLATRISVGCCSSLLRWNELQLAISQKAGVWQSAFGSGKQVDLWKWSARQRGL